jgi:predicted permease
VAAFALGVALLTGLLFGALPAFRGARVDLASALRTSRVGSVQPRLRRLLVILQVALATTLLASSALLTRSLLELRQVALGFDPRHCVSVRIDLPASRYSRVPEQSRFWDHLLEELQRIPGVESAGFVSELPLTGSNLTHDYLIAGKTPPAEGAEPSAGARVVSPGYFQALRIPLLRGRALDGRDREGTLRSVVVNEALVRAEFRGVDPIGERIRFAREPAETGWMTIVGVVGDVKHLGLDQPQEATVYVPYAQNTNPWHRWGEVVIRSAGGASPDLVEQVRERVRGQDRLLPITKIRSLGELVSQTLEGRRFELAIFSSFALLALLLSATGVYGLLAYSVSRRLPELGLRKALGAPDRRVLALVLTESAALTIVGVLLGLAGAAAAGRLMRGLLFGVGTGDPLAFGATVVLVVQVALLASALPALRAARVDPGVALRAE